MYKKLSGKKRAKQAIHQLSSQHAIPRYVLNNLLIAVFFLFKQEHI